jgi:hypothetical protein
MVAPVDGLAAERTADVGRVDMTDPTGRRRPAESEAAPLAAFVDGCRRVNRAPAVWAAVWAITIAVCLPLALAIREALAASLGSSLAAETAADAVNYSWMQEFASTATGLGVTVKPSIVGFAAVLDSTSGFLDRERQPALVLSAAVAYMALWVFLAGGIIDRYARERPVRSHAFFAACGVFFFRFLRLAAIMGGAYVALFGWLHPWLFDDLYPRLTRELTAERNAFAIKSLLYLVFGTSLSACNIVSDYAKVRAVVEDRRSMAGAIRSALRFIFRNFRAAFALYVINLVLFLFVLAAYAAVAPGAGAGGWWILVTFAVSQLYIAGRLWVKLVVVASETALFQRRLAHAGYVAAPAPIWPESPAAEAVSRP